MKKLILLLLVMFFYSNGFAGEIVTLKNGKKVEIKDNGTWSYFVPAEDDGADTYKEISLTDLKTNLNDLDRKKIKTQVFAEMFDFMLTIKQDKMDKTPISVNINSLSHEEREHLHAECIKGCSVTVYGRVADVMYDEKGIIADKIEW